MREIINSKFKEDDKFYIGISGYGADCYENKINVRSYLTRHPLN